MNFIEIQSWPQIPSIGFFVSLFSSSFNLPDFDIEDLEEALLLDSSENNSIDDSTSVEFAPRLIPELIVSLLRGCDFLKPWPNITTSNYQMFLRRLFRYKCEEYNTENPFNTDTDFHSLSLHTKVVILNYLCDFRLDSADVELITNKFETDSLRIEPLGYDSNDSVYWYFFGTRLYREDFPKNPTGKKGERKPDRVWQVICFTEQDWQNLAKKFKTSKSRKESALYKILTEDFLPNIPALFKEKEAERRRRLFQRRSSLRVKGLKERQDEKKQGSDENLPTLSDDSDNRLSSNEKYLEAKKKQLLAKSKIREQIQQERARRAQRRSPSLSSSTSSSKSSACAVNSGFDNVNIVKTDFYSLNDEEAFVENQNICLSNKENILHSNLSLNSSKIKLNKMAPTSTKLPGRQTNNSLSSITGQIVIDPPTATSSPGPGPSTSRKKKVKAEVFLETDEVLQIGMHKVLQHVKNHDDAWPFMDPVEEDIAPRYYSIIKRPMDLLKMEEKLDNGEYNSFTEFRTDFKLIVNNCRLYNGQNNEYTEMVNNLQHAFDRSTKKYFDQTSSDEEPVLLEYPPIEATSSKLNSSKEKEGKKEKFKAKEKKHSKLSAQDNSTDGDDDEDDNEEKSVGKVSHKKLKESKNKSVEEPIKKIDKKGFRSIASDKKKEKSTKGVKRKHKDKDKSDKPKTKKIKLDYSEGEHENYEFDTDKSDYESDNEKVKIDEKKKVKNGNKGEKTSETSKEVTKLNKKSKKSEHAKQISGKRKLKEKSPHPDAKSVVAETKKKSKKIVPQKSEKFSKTNEKANKKRKLEKSIEDNSDSDSDSVHDLIEEKKPSVNDNKSEMKKSKVKASVKDSEKKSRASTSTPKKNDKKSILKPGPKKKEIKKDSKNDDNVSMSSASFSRSPSPLPSINSSAITEDLTNSFDNDQDVSKNSKKKLDSSLRSDTPEIKDKFDLIKERRNKMNQDKEKTKKDHNQSNSQAKEKNHKLKETIEKLKIKNEKSKSQIEFMDEVLGGKILKKESNNIFDKLKNESDEVKPKSSSKKKNDSSSHNDPPVKVKKTKAEKSEEKAVPNKNKVEEKEKEKQKSSAAINNVTPNNKSKKQQNKACLDVLDMETEQTLKDINKWLEHTPRFEYSSASNSPSRYIIDEIDMPSKMDDNDFRKPIPLMPSSPSASHANFQSPTNTPKDFNLLKESNNNKQSATSPQIASTSNKKVGPKEPKRKSLKEKLQQLPRKKEVQRTIDRLQPGKTKGNLLHNIQNINKPEEFFPLGSREKVKEVKNSLIVQTDESSPKLSLGTVLDTQAFNFNDSDNKKQDNECFDESPMKMEEDEKEDKVDDETSPDKTDEPGNKSSNEIKHETKEITKDSDGKANSSDSGSSKPNINAWFKAFGAPKKPKKSESQEDLGKLSDNNDPMKIEGNYMPSHHRRLSTGSSVSERSSVEDSPQVGLDERLGAPAPYPSPIGASPMGASPIMASPKTDDTQKSSANYPANGSIRVGFYQDMTSTKSSPEKSCSPREMPSPYGQYSQHLYSGAGSSSSPGMYGNFYNPENSSANKQGQASYSKPTTSPASYYDQYKQPMSQESDFNNSMSPSTNPNSPYHSQQSSPYQQQPNSPFQSPASGGGSSNAGANTTAIPQAPNSPYSQPNSPYQQPQQAQGAPFHQSSSTASSTTSSVQPQKASTQTQAPMFNNQSSVFPQLGSNPTFNQQHQTSEQFAPSVAQQNCPKASDWNNKPNTNVTPAGYNMNTQQSAGNNFNVASQQPQPLHQNIQAPQINPQSGSAQQLQPQQHHLNPENAFTQNQSNYIKKSANEPQSSGTPMTTPLYGTSKLPDMSNTGYGGIDMVTKSASSANKEPATVASNSNKQQLDNSKYLDLSKQQAAHMNQQQANQYQQMFDLSNFSKAPLDFDMSKSKTMDMFNRSLQKNNVPMSTAACSSAPGFWGNASHNKPVETPPNYGNTHNDVSKIDLSGKTSILNNSAGNSFINNTISHQQPSRNAQPDINYKQPMFNNPAASSMMDLTAFMRDFRQAEERFSSLSGAPPGSFYDKTITPAHMFGKNLQQTNSSAALQQMFNNSMTTMAYNREQQNMNLASYHNRLNTPQTSVPNANQTHSTVAPQAPETKAKKSRKKKNASPEVSVNNSTQLPNQQLQQHHQTQSHQHAQHQQMQHQQLAHQQSFPNYGSLKIPSAAPNSTDPSAISLKSVVPGSAFNYGPTPLTGLYGENPAYLDEFRGTPNPYYPPPPGLGHRSTPDPTIDKASTNPPPAHPQAPSSPYHHLLPPHHPSRSSYPFMNSLDPAALQQQYRMMLNQTYQAGYHPALGMHNQPPHWPHHM